uniref:Uncharacterized protein n=1 Tax=Oryza brachyantha TaxID=4533 RepID=J3LQT0_ORYBR
MPSSTDRRPPHAATPAAAVCAVTAAARSLSGRRLVRATASSPICPARGFGGHTVVVELLAATTSSPRRRRHAHPRFHTPTATASSPIRRQRPQHPRPPHRFGGDGLSTLGSAPRRRRTPRPGLSSRSSLPTPSLRAAAAAVYVVSLNPVLSPVVFVSGGVEGRERGKIKENVERMGKKKGREADMWDPLTREESELSCMQTVEGATPSEAFGRAGCAGGEIRRSERR